MLMPADPRETYIGDGLYFLFMKEECMIRLRAPQEFPTRDEEVFLEFDIFVAFMRAMKATRWIEALNKLHPEILKPWFAVTDGSQPERDGQ